MILVQNGIQTNWVKTDHSSHADHTGSYEARLRTQLWLQWECQGGRGAFSLESPVGSQCWARTRGRQQGAPAAPFWCPRKWVRPTPWGCSSCCYLCPRGPAPVGHMCLGDGGSLFGGSPCWEPQNKARCGKDLGQPSLQRAHKEDLSPCRLTAAGRNPGASFGCLRRHFVLLALFLYQSPVFPELLEPSVSWCKMNPERNLISIPPPPP